MKNRILKLLTFIAIVAYLVTLAAEPCKISFIINAISASWISLILIANQNYFDV